MFLRILLLALVPIASPVIAETIDNCASLLGSISVELRYARNLPSDRRTTFVCPKDTRALIGASKDRIRNSLGPPDATGITDSIDVDEGDGPHDATGAAEGTRVVTRWSYYFTGKPAGERGPGIPELSFSFNAQQQVVSIDCQLTR
jgi:hypothetical protein